MNLEERTFERIAKEFSHSERASIVELLSSCSAPERARVIWDILELSKGSLEKVRHYAEAARVDYRDLLYWAEYYDSDPMLRGRDPKQLVFEILDKWGDEKTP